MKTLSEVESILHNWEQVVRIVRDELARELTDDPVNADEIARARDALSVLVDGYEEAAEREKLD